MTRVLLALAIAFTAAFARNGEPGDGLAEELISEQ